MESFEDGDIVIETDFIEKYTHEPNFLLTCARHDITTLMVAIVHFSPQLWEGGGRVHLRETSVFASEDPAREFYFHLHAKQIAEYYLTGAGTAATAAAVEDMRTPRMHMFTDGCAKTVKGQQLPLFVQHRTRARLCRRSPLRGDLPLQRLPRRHRRRGKECHETGGKTQPRHHWCSWRGGVLGGLL